MWESNETNYIDMIEQDFNEEMEEYVEFEERIIEKNLTELNFN